ncbi:predicted protein [Nematostella vectensis]|uniref:Uncharacterized protein n=1 Tax=Nematostella vectensis TaxID=45351 RepID=A7RUF7_NEMVE|nr:predicted protein [Nematostella vectensis]|eukprot:XP_001636911.1 predicted protein [Nematostella vectensis]
MADASKFRFVFRNAFCMINITCFLYHTLKMDLKSYQIFGGRFKFLTFINMILQGTYFIWVAALEIQAMIDGKRRNTKSSHSCEFLFASLAFPIGLTVSVLFWGLYLIDPLSCQSPEASGLIPKWLNHYMHTLPALEVFAEVILFKHIYPRKIIGMVTVLGFGTAYMAWVFYIAYFHHFWVYPFLERMDIMTIGVFFAASGALLVVNYVIGEIMANNCYFMERKELPESKTK